MAGYLSVTKLFTVVLPAALLGIAVPNAIAQSNYTAFELKRDNNFDSLIIEDINGDGARDLVYSQYRPASGRELYIHLQRGNGSFEATPVRVEIKTEIIAVAFADLRPDPGKELLLYANNGVFSLSPLQQGYAGNIKQLVSWDLIASMPNLERVHFIDVNDLNNDGQIDLILPGIDHYGIFLGMGNEQFRQVSSLSTINESTAAMERTNPRTDFDARVGINPVDGVVLEVSARRLTPFHNFIEQWNDTDSSRNALLRSEQWMPSLLSVQLNGDELLDLAYINVGEDSLGQLNLHYQVAENGFKLQPDWIGSVDSRGNLQLVDMNHDQRLDLLHLRGEGDEWSARLYLNQGNGFNLQQPDQIMRFSGYDVRLNFIQPRPDSLPVLNVSYYTIPVVDAIRNASINRIQLLFGSDKTEAGQLFNRRPDYRLEESFSANNVRGLSEQMSLRYDIDGDGVKDALYITENGTIAAKKINAQLQIADKPFWEYVSTRSVFQFEVLHLNGDTVPDLLLRHGTSTTLLVARP